MLKKFFGLFIALNVVLGVFVSNAAANSTDGGVQITLNLAKDNFDAQDNVSVQVTISNESASAVKILRWLTPVDGVQENLFQVTVDGNPVKYIGPRFKRAAPTDRDYITLKSGDKIETTVNLAGYYDLSQTGSYEFKYNVESYYVFSSKRANILSQKGSLKSDAVQALVEGREKKASDEIKTSDEAGTDAGSTRFVGCSRTRRQTLNRARGNAAGYSSAAVYYLINDFVTQRYVSWFGQYNQGRYATVRENFLKIDDAMKNAPVTFDCSTCTVPAYAYVISNQPYRIYLCSAFWSAPMLGTDSKAGTLIHEMSHFEVVADTDDIVYGQEGSRQLAIENPNDAIRNADSHEYFAENENPSEQ